MPSRRCCAASPRPCWAWPQVHRHCRSTMNWQRATSVACWTSAGSTAFCWTSTWGWNPAIRSPTARSSAADFTGRVNIPPDNVHGPDGSAPDIPAACRAYEDAIRERGGVDLQLLGLGTDGHIGFNEPGSSLASRTRIKTLIEQTRRDNARFFGSLDGGAPPRADAGTGHHPRIPPRRAGGDGGTESAGGP